MHSIKNNCLFTIIIPTHDHKETLNYSIQSVLTQTISDFEVIIVGDGGPSTTDKLMNKWCTRDNRIKYVPNPKGKSHGEKYRHDAISISTGKYIAYNSDDDLWLPNHLETLLPYLQYYDFVHSIHTYVEPNNKIRYLIHQLNNEYIQDRMRCELWNFFGPTTVAHSRSAYDFLPFGWRAKPNGVWSDLHMWRQWVNQSKIKFYTIPRSTTLHFATSTRAHMTLTNRIDELSKYTEKIDKDEFVNSLNIIVRKVTSKI